MRRQDTDPRPGCYTQKNERKRVFYTGKSQPEGGEWHMQRRIHNPRAAIELSTLISSGFCIREDNTTDKAVKVTCQHIDLLDVEERYAWRDRDGEDRFDGDISR